MALRKLGNTELQQQGSESREQTHDQTTHQVLSDMLLELRYIRHCLMHMSGLELDQRDIEHDNK